MLTNGQGGGHYGSARGACDQVRMPNQFSNRFTISIYAARRAGCCAASSQGRIVAKTTLELKKFGQLDILVNNAAFQEHADGLEDLSEKRFEETFRTNIFGYFHMAKAALPHLGKGACIINTGSVTGLEGSAKLLDYSATKGAIHAFTKSLASNLIDKGIRVNAVAPGPVWSPLNPADKSAEDIQTFGKDTDMKRPAQPEEISPAYVFLAAPVCSGYITGIVLPLDHTGNRLSRRGSPQHADRHFGRQQTTTGGLATTRNGICRPKLNRKSTSIKVFPGDE